jgi:FMN-dependent NADH-azoreductase
MATLLHIIGSPRTERSHSTAVARAFTAAYAKAHPDDTVETWNLWETELPAFDGPALDAKYAVLHGQEATPGQRAAWGEVRAVFDRFDSADKYVFSLPMWNFGIPYRVKHFIDVVTQPGMAFNYAPDTGYTGLVTGKPATVIYARGGNYAPGSGAETMNLQQPYMELWLRFIGFTDIHTVAFQPTLADQETTEAARRDGLATAESLAAAM